MLFCLYTAIGERRGMEPNGVQSYLERDWFAARRKAKLKKQKGAR